MDPGSGILNTKGSPAMLKLYLAGDETEDAAMQSMAESIARTWPDIIDDPDSHIHLYGSPRLHGQRVEDLDLLIVGKLAHSRSFTPLFGLPVRDGKHLRPESIEVDSFCMTVEIKAQPMGFVRFEGTKAIVGYREKSKDASKQAASQRYGLKDYLMSVGIKRPPSIVDTLWLTQVPDARLPARPHNIIGAGADWTELLSTVALNRQAREEKGDGVRLTALGYGGDIQDVIDVFSNDPTLKRLDMAKLPPQRRPQAAPIDPARAIALDVAREHVAYALLAISAVADMPEYESAQDPKIEAGMLRASDLLVKTDLLDQSQVEEQAKYLDEGLMTVSKLALDMKNHIYRMNRQEANKGIVRGLYEWIELVRETACDLRAVMDEKDVVSLEESRVTSMIGLGAGRVEDHCEILSQSALSVAWDGVRVLAALEAGSGNGGRLDAYGAALRDAAMAGDARKRQELGLTVLTRIKADLHSADVPASPIFAKALDLARKNIDTAREWLANPQGAQARAAARKKAEARGQTKWSKAAGRQFGAAERADPATSGAATAAAARASNGRTAESSDGAATGDDAVATSSNPGHPGASRAPGETRTKRWRGKPYARRSGYAAVRSEAATAER